MLRISNFVTYLQSYSNIHFRIRFSSAILPHLYRSILYCFDPGSFFIKYEASFFIYTSTLSSSKHSSERSTCSIIKEYFVSVHVFPVSSEKIRGFSNPYLASITPSAPVFTIISYAFSFEFIPPFANTGIFTESLASFI